MGEGLEKGARAERLWDRSLGGTCELSSAHEETPAQLAQAWHTEPGKQGKVQSQACCHSGSSRISEQERKSRTTMTDADTGKRRKSE